MTYQIKDGKKQEKLHYKQRRKELLRMIITSGHPNAISQRAYAEHFGVSQAQISHDYKVIKDNIINEIGIDYEVKVEMFYNKAMLHYIQKEEYDKALPIVKGWTDWLFKTGKVGAKPDISKLEVTNKPPLEILDFGSLPIDAQKQIADIIMIAKQEAEHEQKLEEVD
jgi:hypothetical protein